MIVLSLFWTFFKIGLFTFGGGYAMIPMISSEVVSLGWIDESTLIDFIAVSESTPGPFAVNISTFIGNSVGGGGLMGILCAAVSTLGVVLPSFIIILAVSKVFFRFRDSKWVSGTLSGIRPAVIGLIGSAAVSILLKNLFAGTYTLEALDWVSLAVTAVLFVLSRLKLAGKKLHPIAIIGIAACAGLLIYGVL